MFKLTADNKLSLRLEPAGAAHLFFIGSAMLAAGVILFISSSSQYSWEAVNQATDRLSEMWWRPVSVTLAVLALSVAALKLARRSSAVSEWCGALSVYFLLITFPSIPLVGIMTPDSGTPAVMIVMGWVTCSFSISAWISTKLLRRIGNAKAQ